ncbi:hypothetical protein AMTR_s00063p00152970 [Amborella trichopoda]|uniref:Uncharacterized protein n=1 Tax=Amborella trichopoda TaxID=13333 RepID=U5D4B1_AMBTC|nr:hypothetical protein AMTR_s00063p00152970 [Amborella trichopoda]
MYAQRVTILDLGKHEIIFEDGSDLHELPQGTLTKTISDWETQLNWGRLHLKTPSQVATPQHLQRGLVLASSIGLPQLEAKEKKEKLLKSMKVDFTGEVVVVEEALPVSKLFWSPVLRRKRRRKREV